MTRGSKYTKLLIVTTTTKNILCSKRTNNTDTVTVMHMSQTFQKGLSGRFAPACFLIQHVVVFGAFKVSQTCMATETLTGTDSLTS